MLNRLVIKHELLDRGLTLAVLSKRVGISYDRLVRIVNGYREPREEEVAAIAKALELPIASLTDDVDGERDSEPVGGNNPW